MFITVLTNPTAKGGTFLGTANWASSVGEPRPVPPHPSTVEYSCQ